MKRVAQHPSLFLPGHGKRSPNAGMLLFSRVRHRTNDARPGRSSPQGASARSKGVSDVFLPPGGHLNSSNLDWLVSCKELIDGLGAASPVEVAVHDEEPTRNDLLMEHVEAGLDRLVPVAIKVQKGNWADLLAGAGSVSSNDPCTR